MTFSPLPNSRATILYDYVVEYMSQTGDIVDYPTMFAMFDMDYQPGQEVPRLISHVISSVNHRLLTSNDWRQLVSIPNVGYKIASPSDLRNEALSRSRHIIRQQSKIIAATYKTTIHPDATTFDRKSASDALVHEHALANIIKKSNRKLISIWPSQETSPVQINSDSE